MGTRFKTSFIAALSAAAGTAVVLVLGTAAPSDGQAAAYRAPRAKDGTGKPDLSGVWQAVNEANWDLLDHGSAKGPVAALGAAFSRPPGLSVVEGNEIPYKPEALAKKKSNGEQWLKLDPEVKCYLPGVPRATYQPYPFEIVQTPEYVLLDYEFNNAARIVPLKDPGEAPVDSWMGWSKARWDGETLVIDVSDFVDNTWFDRAGDYHSEQLKVTERYTPVSRDVLQYEATITDPKVFTRPWKIRFPLYRRLEPHAQLLEYKCVEFVEDLMWGPLNLRKQDVNKTQPAKEGAR